MNAVNDGRRTLALIAAVTSKRAPVLALHAGDGARRGNPARCARRVRRNRVAWMGPQANPARELQLTPCTAKRQGRSPDAKGAHQLLQMGLNRARALSRKNDQLMAMVSFGAFNQRSINVRGL